MTEFKPIVKRCNYGKNSNSCFSVAQRMYRLPKEGKCKVNLRARFEDCHLPNEDGYFEAVMRFRFQVRAFYSFTKNVIDKNAPYVFV